MTDDVDKSGVTRIAEIGIGRAHPDGFAALPMQIAPIPAQRGLLHHAQRVGTRKLLTIDHQANFKIAFGAGDEVLDDTRTVAIPDLDSWR